MWLPFLGSSRAFARGLSISLPSRSTTGSGCRLRVRFVVEHNSSSCTNDTCDARALADEVIAFLQSLPGLQITSSGLPSISSSMGTTGVPPREH